VARLEPPVDTELTDDEDDETVIQRAQHATIRPGGRTARGRGRRRKRHYQKRQICKYKFKANVKIPSFKRCTIFNLTMHVPTWGMT
jgi:hypothetical protein